MTEPYVNFEELKEDVNILDVARKCGFDLSCIDGSGIFYHGLCHMPTHGEHHKKREFVVNVPENYWQCWSKTCNQNNKGKRGGDVIGFLATFRGIIPHAAALLLDEWFGRPPEQKKAPPASEVIPPANDAHATREPVNPTAQAEPVKPRYMQEVELWYVELKKPRDKETSEEYEKRILNGIKAKLLDSYKAGKNAGPSKK